MRRLPLRSAYAAGLLVTLVAGCGPAAEPEPNPSHSPASTSIDWTDCADLQCATVTVPLDWSDPDGATIELAVTRHAATAPDSLGSLLVNPGGPGSSAVDYLPTAVEKISAQVVASYDIVAFDPRGVGQSTSVDCVDDEDLDAMLSADASRTAAERTELAERWEHVGDGCLQRTGDLLAHLDTQSTARDMDRLRELLGDDLLNFIGYSYGSELGATYAALFPQRVGRMVLDGALDPTLTAAEVTLEQAGGFETALRAYVQDCQANNDECPLPGDVEDGLALIGGLLDVATRDTLGTGTDRALTGALAFDGIAVTLYSQEYWDILSDALDEAINHGRGSMLLKLADIFHDRQDDGSYEGNSTEAFWAISCADSRWTDEDITTLRTRLGQVAPTVGPWFADDPVTCASWPTEPAPALESYAADGAGPILVVGTTHDPATPYRWAQQLASTLESGVLVTYEGEGHTAYRATNTCIAAVVDAYLLDGTTPAADPVCS